MTHSKNAPIDWESFAANPSNAYHMLRHFDDIDPDYCTSLIGKPYRNFDYVYKKFYQDTISQQDIEYALNTIGGGFDGTAQGIENPSKLITRCKAQIQKKIADKPTQRSRASDGWKTEFTLYYPTIVWELVIRIKSELSSEDIARIITQPRSQHPSEQHSIVQTLSGIPKEQTDYLHIWIHDVSYLPFYFLSIFPTLSPQEQERRYGKDAWKTSFDEIVFFV